MLTTVILDFSAPPENADSVLESRFYPFLYLLADQIAEAGVVREPPSPDTEAHHVVSSPFRISKISTIGEGRPHFLDLAVAGEGVLFTPRQDIKATYLQRTGLSAQSAVLLLAAAGLEISLPALTVNVARTDEILQVREKLDEERKRYLLRVTELADATYQRLRSGDYTDAAAWAVDQASLKIAPAARSYELAIQKLNRPLLKRLGLNLLAEGVPAITSTMFEHGMTKGAAKAIQVILEVLARNLALSIEERQRPEGVYGVKLAKSIRPAKA